MKKPIADHVLEVLEWPYIHGELINRCRTEPGRQYASGIHPLQKDEIKKQLQKISELKDAKNQGHSPDMSGITDIEPYLELAKKEGALSIEELVSIKNFILASGRIKGFLKEIIQEFPGLEEEYNNLDDLKEISGIIIPAITDSNDISDSRYPVLKKLRNEIHTGKKKIEKKLSAFISSGSSESALQEKLFTRRNDRYTVLVKANMKSRVKGNVQDISSSGATLYIEPDSITELNNSLIMNERELILEINKILQILTAHAADSAPELKQNLLILGYLDFLNAASIFSNKIGGNEPEISDEPVVRLIKARHPILCLFDKESVVPNNIDLGTSFNCLVISGANTGGKTVLLKTIGLSALLTMYGLHIPASPDSVIGVFTDILADIGDDQNLSQSLSTFSGQLMVIKDMLDRAERNTLIIIDEIIVGTNPRQGAALAQSILEQLIKTESRIVVTTHYTELKELSSADNRFQNASVSFNMETLKPDYKLHTGFPGPSYAIEIARTCKFPESILNRSKDLLDQKEISIEALMERMQTLEEERSKEKEQLLETKGELESKKKSYKEKENKLKKRIEEIKHGQGIEFLELLNKYKESVSEKIHSLQTANLREAGKVQDSLLEIENEIRETMDQRNTERFIDSYNPVNPEEIAPGDLVFIPSIEKTGEITEINKNQKIATILLGGTITLKHPLDELMAPRGTKKSSSAKKKKSVRNKPEKSDAVKIVPSTIQTQYNTINLLGLRVHEALASMTSGLDSMTKNGIFCAVIIHGHGTGALRDAVRESLKTSHYVYEFRPGEQGEGGDGVTIVLLRD